MCTMEKLLYRLYLRIAVFLPMNVELKFFVNFFRLLNNTLEIIILNEFLRAMKDFVFVKFANGSSDAVYKSWMLGSTLCYWPPKDKNVRKLAEEKADWELSWKKYKCTILCQASKSAIFKLFYAGFTFCGF